MTKVWYGKVRIDGSTKLFVATSPTICEAYMAQYAKELMLDKHSENEDYDEHAYDGLTDKEILIKFLDDLWYDRAETDLIEMDLLNEMPLDNKAMVAAAQLTLLAMAMERSNDNV
jgi:hypothetical protein